MDGDLGWGALVRLFSPVCVRFSCNLYSRFFQCKILIYVHPQKTTIPALFWTVLVSDGLVSGISVVLH